MTPEQEEQVRRALEATARHEPTTPLPPEVADRLDGVLAELTAARRADPGSRPAPGPDELAPRRGRPDPRRAGSPSPPRARWPRVLGAAAAVALVVGLGTVVARHGLSGGDDSTTGGSAASRAQQGAGDSGAERLASPAPGDASSPSGPSLSGPGGRDVPRLRGATLAADVRGLLSGGLGGRDRAQVRARNACLPAPPGPGERSLAVRLDGRSAALLVSRGRGGVRVARVYACRGADGPVATVRVRPSAR